MFGNRSIVTSNTSLIRPLQFIRLKRTKANKKGLAPHVVKLITQLSVLSAARKQPKMLKLCQEDIIKHETITKAWALLQKKEDQRVLKQLQSQEALIREANAELQQVSPTLFDKSNVKNFGKRFSMELRIPTKFPPRVIWNYDIKKSAEAN